MIDSRAEQSFASGRRMLETGRHREAVAFFRAATELAGSGRATAFQARYLSYYGLSLCLSRSDYRLALTSCRNAAALESDRPELWWNLGRVAFKLGRRGEAHRAWSRGLDVDPEHTGIHGELRRMGRRKVPVLSFLPRQHPLNVALGRFRARSRAREQQRRLKPQRIAPAAERIPIR